MNCVHAWLAQVVGDVVLLRCQKCGAEEQRPANPEPRTMNQSRTRRTVRPVAPWRT